MKINIKATGIELTAAISDYVNKKISSISKYLANAGGNLIVEVEVGKSTQHHKTGNVFKAEIHITGGGLDLYAVCEEMDLYAAIDVVRDEIVHTIAQSKGKRQALARRGAELVKNVIKGLTNFRKT